MPIGVMEFPELRAPQVVSPFAEAVSKGLQTYNEGLQSAYAQKQLEAELSLKEAQAKKETAQANLPFGGANIKGPAGQIVGLEMVRKYYGEDSPQYQRALNLFNLTNQSTGSRIHYQDVLANTLPTRALTPTGKTLLEQSNVMQGFSPTGQPQSIVSGQQPQGQTGGLATPTGQIPQVQQNANATPGYVAPGSPEDLSNQYALLRQKQTTDVDTRKRNLFASNIEKTLSQINPKDLTQYAGLQGGIQRKLEQGLAATGSEAKAYDDYLTSKQAVEFLTTQVRQFYGDSIQPAMLERLQRLSDPSTWTTNPKLAEQLFNTTKNILSMEMQTYRQALKTPAIYQGQASPNAQPQSLTKAHVTDENIQETMRQTGLSRDQVLSKLKAKGLI